MLDCPKAYTPILTWSNSLSWTQITTISLLWVPCTKACDDHLCSRIKNVAVASQPSASSSVGGNRQNMWVLSACCYKFESGTSVSSIPRSALWWGHCTAGHCSGGIALHCAHRTTLHCTAGGGTDSTSTNIALKGCCIFRHA
jgi:hypothetical protein